MLYANESNESTDKNPEVDMRHCGLWYLFIRRNNWQTQKFNNNIVKSTDHTSRNKKAFTEVLGKGLWDVLTRSL